MSRPVSRTDTVSAAFGSARLPVSAGVATVLASICLGGAFLTGTWFFPATFAVIVSVSACEVARRLSTPRSFVPLAGVAALLVYLVFVYARDDALLWFIPNRASLSALHDLLQSGRADVSRYAAPIAVSPGIEFMVAAGVGLVAVAVDTLAVTMRRAALAGLPLLALYTVPTSVAPDGVGWVAFALGGIGYLTLLLAEARERVSRWGRPMRYTAPRPNWRPDADTAPLAQVGRRVGAAALGLALVVPAVLPDISGSTFGFGGNGFGRGGGGNKVEVINPIIDLGKDLRRGQNRPVLQYRGKADYVRLASLDVFGGDKWSPSSFRVQTSRNDVTDGFTRPPGLTADVKTVSRKYSLQIFDLRATWLPIPYAPVRVSDIDGRWVYDPASFNVIPTNGAKDSFSYRARTLEVVPTVEQLRAAGPPPDAMSRYLQLPTDMPEVLDRTARAWTDGAKSGFDAAVSIQNALRSDLFTYSTQVEDTLGDANGVQAIAAFLEQRQGYCVHFASTMAVMARDLGIPARVAVGFTAGKKQRDGSHIVSTHDAHAWPELYFQGVGWVRFEPTPDGSRTPSPGFSNGVVTGVTGGPGAPTGIPTGGTQQNPRVAEGLPHGIAPDEPSRSGAGGRSAEGAAARRFPLLPTVLVLAVVVAALLPLSARSWIRRRRWSRASSPALLALAAWDELRDTLLDHGYDWPSSDPPRRGAARVARERHLRGPAAAALTRLAQATERVRYATELGDIGDLRADVDSVRAALGAEAGRWGRLRARLLPRSVRSVSADLSERLADLLDLVDGLGARLSPRRTG